MRCEWCGAPTDDTAPLGFCDVNCRRAWLDEDRRQEYAADAAYDAAMDAASDAGLDDDVTVEFDDEGDDQ